MGEVSAGASERVLEACWCPRCKVQSEKLFHFCERGPSLIPQLDVETRCEVIPVVPRAELEAAVERAVREERERTERWLSHWAFNHRLGHPYNLSGAYREFASLAPVPESDEKASPSHPHEDPPTRA